MLVIEQSVGVIVLVVELMQEFKKCEIDCDYLYLIILKFDMCLLLDVVQIVEWLEIFLVLIVLNCCEVLVIVFNQGVMLVEIYFIDVYVCVFVQIVQMFGYVQQSECVLGVLSWVLGVSVWLGGCFGGCFKCKLVDVVELDIGIIEWNVI